MQGSHFCSYLLPLALLSLAPFTLFQPCLTISYTRYIRNHQSNIPLLSSILSKWLEIQPSYLLLQD